MKHRIAGNRHMKIISLLLILCLTGCGTIFSKSGEDGKHWGKVYTGVQCSAQMASVSVEKASTLILFPLTLVDMVISAVTDTLILPIDLVVTPTTDDLQNPCNLK